MDDHSFDTLTRRLGSGFSRRGALRAALGGLVAAAGANALSAEAKNGKQAKRKGKQSQRLQAQTDEDPKQCDKCSPGGEPKKGCAGHPCDVGSNACCTELGLTCAATATDKVGRCCYQDGQLVPEADKAQCCNGWKDGKCTTPEPPKTCATTTCDSKARGNDPCKKVSDNCVCGDEGYCVEETPPPPNTCPGGSCTLGSCEIGCACVDSVCVACVEDGDTCGAGDVCCHTPTSTCVHGICQSTPPETCGGSCPDTVAGVEDPCKVAFGGKCRCIDGTCQEKEPPVCSCEGKTCGDDDGCGHICGGCDHGFCVIDEDGQHAHCKTPPVCAPNGEPGICCSGYHRHDGICCDADDPGAVSITVTTNVFNAITITTPPNTTIVTVTVPPTPVPPTPPRRRRRRHHHRHGGRH